MGIGRHTPLTITPGPRFSQTNMAVGTSVAVTCDRRLHRCKVCKGVVAQHLRVDKHHSQNERIRVWDRKWGIRCMSDKGINAKDHPSCTMGRLPSHPTIDDTWSVCTTALAHPCTAVAHLLNGGVRWRHHNWGGPLVWGCLVDARAGVLFNAYHLHVPTRLRGERFAIVCYTSAS